MIVDKKNNGEVLSGNKDSILASEVPIPQPEEIVEVPEQVPSNSPIAILTAVKEILSEVTWEYGVENSPKIFRTVQIDDGQYNRIINVKGNQEETIGFPAAFVHFIDWHYLVQTNRINEGRATLRIKFILNNIDTHTSGRDMDVYYVAERVQQTIQELKPNYPCMSERFQLDYIDPMESFDKCLQPCWMTYEVWFKTDNIWIKRNKVYRKFVIPPFTNHADQDPFVPNINPGKHTNLDHPTKYDEATSFEP